MKFPIKKTNKVVTITIFAVVVLCFVGLCIVFAKSRFNIIPQVISSRLQGKEKTSFPVVDTTNLSTNQKKLIEILKAEYATNSPGTKYSGGVEEAWCADFISWVFNEAGTPLSNPNTGSWRIPGTYTLREYYESIGKLQLANSGYSPKVGDIMLYDNPSPFGQHTNIVIKNEHGVVTTIGGNEPGGIRVVEHLQPDVTGFIGYGVF